MRTMFSIYWFFNNIKLTQFLVAAALTTLPTLWLSRVHLSTFKHRSFAQGALPAISGLAVILFWHSARTSGESDLVPGILKFGFSTLNYLHYTIPVEIAFSLDSTSTPFFLVTLLLGCVAIMFSHFYMEGEVYKTRFVQLLTAFLLSMLLLISANNLITLFLGWELIGLFSFLLINFWTIKITSIKSANKALAYNQLSDALFIITLICYSYEGVAIPTETTGYVAGANTLATLALVGCVCCKSAQFPLHYWLPDSMEAPIPASALIHSATLVSAGVYLVIRLSPYHLYNQWLTQPLLTLSLVTVVVGGLASCAQNDLKKILAYSTIANCGFMVMFASLNKESLCFLYFALHGVFKASAFFIIGTVVISSNHRQDWRYAQLPLGQRKPILLLLLPTIALLGAWPGTMTGFVKHLNVDLVSDSTIHELIRWVSYIGTLTSLVYSSKIITLLLQYDSTKQTNRVGSEPHALQQSTQVCALLLTVLTVVLIYLNNSDFLSLLQGNNVLVYRSGLLQKVSPVLLGLLSLSYCFWSKQTTTYLTYLVVMVMLVSQSM